jgi:hypothetical protein
MKKLVVMFSVVGMLLGMQGCMQMPTKVYRKSSSAKVSPAKHHPYPIRAKSRSNQKHLDCNW